MQKRTAEIPEGVLEDRQLAIGRAEFEEEIAISLFQRQKVYPDLIRGCSLGFDVFVIAAFTFVADIGVNHVSFYPGIRDTKW